MSIPIAAIITRNRTITTMGTATAAADTEFPFTTSRSVSICKVNNLIMVAYERHPIINCLPTFHRLPPNFALVSCWHRNLQPGTVKHLGVPNT